MNAAATAVTLFHRPADDADFRAWLARMTEIAETAEGFVGAAVAVSEDPQLEPGFSITFRSEQLLHHFLDSSERARSLSEGESLGFRRKSSDLIIVEGGLPPPGTGIFRHSVARGKETEFAATEARLVAASSTFPGFEGAALFPSGEGGRWFSVLRFRTGSQLTDWMRSDDRAAALPELRSKLTEDFTVDAHTTPFGSTMRTIDGQTKMTPTWKIAMLVLLVLYPTVMTLSRFLGPVLDRAGAAPWLAMWLSQIVSVGLMSYVLSPAVAARFRRWLDPIDGAGLRISAAGAAVIVVLYALTLLLFASVTWLQYWDYNE
ncbi:antibiotic biosynthesis monooxygenase [Nocardia sp. NBC_00508]|uniref:antibiotic biosynthesis monooxygenase n=1 Tax=Nocardia sp. NBC_00508 TaxID=2975992 RepID=UPI002E818DA2|nr:antibiotic biosynthesis monooxygenase [Nocardia sp. NBC_00508]WUD69656.1 antibiotic biosynthesis monooxygenase [Nocardia sp. NBC_00508]